MSDFKRDKYTTDRARGCARMDRMVMQWNESLIRFYEKVRERRSGGGVQVRRGGGVGTSDCNYVCGIHETNTIPADT
ncbi:MAG: hypothetical protein V1862_07725 [Methanobacteriota archaeon]